ncbi:MAG: nicotinamide-nucleotide amidohydrolase family protein [Spirochaetales bacterium]|nr:nicotinamide-nucleotide amidohydrolase family protein [Spirochaetales bacterium]
MKTRIVLLSTGTELSSGRSIDGNGPYMARELVAAGYEIAAQHILPDNTELLLETLEQFLKGPAPALIMSGGLGPTADDLTIDVLALLTNDEIVEDPAAFQKLQASARRMKSQLRIEEARRQVRTLRLAQVIKNEAGLAPGLCVRVHSKSIYALPGVPQEMRAMFQGGVLPDLQKHYPTDRSASQHYYIYGVGESRFQREFSGLGLSLDWGVTAGYGSIKFSVYQASLPELVTLKEWLGNAFREQVLVAPVEELLAAELLKRSETLGLAESCTGGLVGRILTDAPGASAYFKGGIVAYANSVKERVLQVDPAILSEQGAVSAECALAMARGARAALHVDHALSITGIAGPDGGTAEKPVGTVHLAYVGPERSETLLYSIPLDRERIRLYAAYSALFLAYRSLF